MVSRKFARRQPESPIVTHASTVDCRATPGWVAEVVACSVSRQAVARARERDWTASIHRASLHDALGFNARCFRRRCMTFQGRVAERPRARVCGSAMPTHEVLNQPPPLEGYNLFATDRALVEGVRREGAAWAEERLGRLGQLAGGEALGWGVEANANPPVLRTHDRYGHRIDEVEFHPAWHALLRLAVGHELHALPWRDPRPGAHVARAALCFVLEQVEAGHGCPISMTYSVIPALRAQPEVAAEWQPCFTSTAYDPRLVPVAEKTGALCGMAMTEKQGGSDV